MKLIIILLCSFALAGCASMTPDQKRTAWIVGGVVVGAIILSDDSSDKQNCKPTVGGSGADFDFSCR